MFEIRSNERERIDTGDYTPEEYKTFLREIRFINRYLGDGRALKKTLFAEIEKLGLRSFSVLDVGCGSGELLRMIGEFAAKAGRDASLIGLDLNPISTEITKVWSKGVAPIDSIQGDAFQLPFSDNSFDYAISSLFFHHLTDEQIIEVLNEMSRVARRGLVVIDLHRDPVAFVGYKIFCFVFRISRLVREDGSLSIRKGFWREELRELAVSAGFAVGDVVKVSPGRVVLQVNK